MNDRSMSPGRGRPRETSIVDPLEGEKAGSARWKVLVFIEDSKLRGLAELGLEDIPSEVKTLIAMNLTDHPGKGRTPPKPTHLLQGVGEVRVRVDVLEQSVRRWM